MTESTEQPGSGKPDALDGKVSPAAEILVFPDTNVLLHGKGLEELPFVSIVGEASSIVVVLTRTVIRELDAQKVKNPNNGLRERATKRARALWRRQKERKWVLRPGVSLSFAQTAAVDNLAQLGLDSSLGDDRIIAEVLSARDAAPNQRVIFLSRDTGMLVKAAGLGLEVVEFDDEHVLPVPDEQQAKLRKLQEENERLRSRVPRLSVTFEDGKDVCDLSVELPRRLSEAEIRERCEEAGRAIPAMRVAGSTGLERLTGVNPSIFGGLAQPSEAAVRKFDEDRDAWLARLADYYRTSWEEDASRVARTVCVSLVLVNSGTCSATDVRVDLAFPEAILLSEERPAIKGRPPQPKRPRSILASLAPDIGALSKGTSLERLLGASGSPPNTRGPWFDKDEAGRPRVRLEVRKATQQCELRLPRFFALLPALDVASSFHAEVSILSEELPEWAESRLDVHVVVSADHTEAERDDRPFEA